MDRRRHAGNSRAMTKVIEVFMLVFGFVVGSGFDSLLEWRQEESWQQKLIRALLYGMGISVITRFSLGSALHLHIEYGVTANWSDRGLRRSALFFDVMFFLLYAMILRYAVAFDDITCFFVGQVLLFAVALVWAFVVWAWLARCHSHKTRVRWKFWNYIDGLNFLLALLALWLLHDPPSCVAGWVSELPVIGASAFFYVVILFCDLLSLFKVADEARLGES